MAADARKNVAVSQLTQRNALLVDKVNDLKRLSQLAAKGGAVCVPISVLNQVDDSLKILTNALEKVLK